MLIVDYEIIAYGKKEYKEDKYPTRYYGYTKYGVLINVSEETYELYEKDTELYISWYKDHIYIKEKTLKGE